VSARTTRLAAGVALAALALTYGYNVQRNFDGRAEVHDACVSIRRSIDERMKVESLAMLVDDPPALARDLRAEIDAPCVTIEPRLAWWRWNLGAHVPIPPDPARAARLEDTRVKMIAKCIPVIQRLLDASNLTGASPEALDAQARDTCDEIGASLHPPTSEGDAPIPVWDWPDRLAALARSLAPEAPSSAPRDPPAPPR
jgi:hypothetical protein